jgi:uncharacterized protein YacL
MKPKSFLRLALFIVFGFIGAFVARSGTPPDIFAITGGYFLLAAVIAFATLGFILPDVLELAGRAGIAALAKQIADHIPNPAGSSISVRNFSFRGRKNKKNSGYVNPLVVDTSALIDGRLAEVAQTGFLFGSFLVIPSVIGELHKLSDSADLLKRAKGRRGLDILDGLKKNKKIKVEILGSEPKDLEVDDKLVSLARKLKGRLLTVDYNLNKVSKVRGVDILNINELANAVKTAVLPKDSLDITVSAKGREKGQGVGYLQDGTMVVVENGADFEGKNVRIEVQRVLQTAAGKMIFAKIRP